jgi:hypothetical protein
MYNFQARYYLGTRVLLKDSKVKKVMEVLPLSISIGAITAKSLPDE